LGLNTPDPFGVAFNLAFINFGGGNEEIVCVYALLWVNVVVFSWYVCCGGGYERCVYSKGGFPCVGKIDVIMCGGGFDKVDIHFMM
jgi:hypothetical protein